MKNEEFYFDYNIQKVCLALPDFDFLIKASAGLYMIIVVYFFKFLNQKQ